jgi:hypothetical protein
MIARVSRLAARPRSDAVAVAAVALAHAAVLGLCLALLQILN